MPPKKCQKKAGGSLALLQGSSPPAANSPLPQVSEPHIPQPMPSSIFQDTTPWTPMPSNLSIHHLEVTNSPTPGPSLPASIGIPTPGLKKILTATAILRRAAIAERHGQRAKLKESSREFLIECAKVRPIYSFLTYMLTILMWSKLIGRHGRRDNCPSGTDSSIHGSSLA